ncbi:MAG: hypothetical protein J0M18_12300 [Ignavibacteria bacterium]|nr:hypothetical protein [Ignavibacteria bacterium]
MRKFIVSLLILFFLSGAFLLIKTCNPKKPVFVRKECAIVDSLKNSLSHYPAVANRDTSFLIGGVANDSITNTVVIYNTKTYTKTFLPDTLPQKLMDGFAFKLGDTMYYGGGYTENWINADTSTHQKSFYSIKYTDSTTGFAASDSGKIYKTSNSGLTWAPQQLTTLCKLRSLFYSNINIGWVITDSAASKIFKTTNGGISWDSGIIIGPANIKSINFISADTGWAAGNTGQIFMTVNGGTNWSSFTTGSTANLNSIFFVNQNLGWACGDSTILRTTNGGINWLSQSFGSNELNDISFSDNSTGYIVGMNGTIAKTINGGTSWNNVQVPSTQPLRSIVTKDTNIYVCGDRGNVIYSTNGLKWERTYGITPNNLQSICIIPGGLKAAVCGLNGFTSYAKENCFKYKFSQKVYKRVLTTLPSPWISCVDLPFALSEVFSSAGAINNTTAYVVGGRTSATVYSSKILQYSSSTGRWIICEGKGLPEARSYGGLAVIEKNTMLYLGGINSINVSDIVYKIEVNALSDTVTTAAITGSAIYPLGPIYGMGSTGVKYRGLGVFSGGMDGNYNFYRYYAKINSKLVIDTFYCDALDPISTPIIIVPGFYTINWACPTMDGGPITLYGSRYEILPDNQSPELPPIEEQTASGIPVSDFATRTCQCMGIDIKIIEEYESSKKIEIMNVSFLVAGGIEENFNPAYVVVFLE